MRILKFSLSLILLVAVMIGCTKDGINFDRPSHGQLTDSLGNCLPKIIEGTYTSGITFTSDNFIDVYTNIDTVGKYEIFTDTVNGVSFYGTGRLGEKGENRVRIYGTGRPLSGGTFTFTVKYGASRCKVPVKFDGLVVPPAAFTYAVEAGACAGAVLAGTYSTNIATNADNKVTLKVNVTTAGLYNISTTAVNGVTFSASGSFTSTGAQTVVLKASGVPAAVGSFNYTVSAGSSSCTFSVATEKGPDAAVFTLGGAPSACSGFAAAGTYKAGTALTGSNTVTTKVVVTSIGAYSITTNTVNGISFSASGTFTATGEQSVTLKGTGTPTAAGSNNFTATAGTSTCTFSITTESGGGGGSSSPCTGLTENKFSLANGLSAEGTITAEANTSAAPFYYHVSINTLDVVITFQGITAKPAVGTYTIGTSLSIVYMGSDFSVWGAQSGKVYVSKNDAGATVIEFCGIPFSQVTGSGKSTGQGKIVLPL